MTYGDVRYTFESLEPWPDVPLPPADAMPLVARLTIENPLPTETVAVRAERFALLRSDGTLQRGMRAQGSGLVTIAPEGKEPFSVRFDVPLDFDATEWTFVVGTPERIVELIPLGEGPVPASAYPLTLDVAGQGPAQGAGTGCRQRLRVRVEGAEVGIDPGVGRRTHARVEYVDDRRALAGRRFLTFAVRVTNRGGSLCGGGQTNLDDSDFRLVVDDLVLTPANSTIETLDVRESVRVEVMFEVPVDARSVKLRIGAGRRQVRVAVPWEDLPVPPGEVVAEIPPQA